MADINSPAALADPGVEQWPDGELPEQMGGTRTTLMPGIFTFKIPDNLSQLWHEVEIEDSRPYLANGQPNPTKGQKIKRQQLKFDRNAPLVVVGGQHDGEPMTATFTNNPRPRGKKDDPKTAWISDLAYFLDIGLQGQIKPEQRVRPTSVAAMQAAINKFAGKTVRIETGLTAQCRPDKPRYIPVVVMENGQRVETSMQDPSGQKGCGKRYYTPDFKDPATGAYDREILCACSGAPGDPGAVLRGFENVERILTPLGT
jgi:hypothetical protein